MALPLFEHARKVRFQDIDAAGILFFARVFEYFHDAFAAFLEARGVDMVGALRDGRWGAPLGHAEADFKAPMRYGDPIVVEIERVDIGKSSLTLHYRIRAADDATRVYCSGKSVNVFIDSTSFKAMAVPDDVRTALGG